MKVSLDAPYPSVHLVQGGLDYGKHYKENLQGSKELQFLPKSQEIMHFK